MSGQGLRAPRPPRAFLLATGEEVPQGHSVRARLLIVELRPGDVDRAALTRSQNDAEEAQYATAMGGYLAWVAGRYEELQGRLKTRIRELRQRNWGFRRRRTLIPEGTRTAFRAEGEQFSERSDAGTSIVQEVFGFVKGNLSGA